MKEYFYKKLNRFAILGIFIEKVLMYLVLVFFGLTACSDVTKLPRPPLSFPFNAQNPGFKIEADFRVIEFDVYSLELLFAFNENDPRDRDRVKKLAGDPAQDKSGKLIQPGVPVSVRIYVKALNPSTLEKEFENLFHEQKVTGFGDAYYAREITTLRLRPGTYSLVVENLHGVPDLQGTPVTLRIDSRPKTNPIKD
ncbi:MAG: DUF5625 family protein [Polaromonas sp.]